MTSSPTLIGNPPGVALILLSHSAKPGAFSFCRCPNSPDAVRNVLAVYALRKLFSIVCGDASSPRNCTMISPVRPMTATVTRLPCALQVSDAVVAIASAVASDRSLWFPNCAPAGLAIASANATTPPRPTDNSFKGVMFPPCTALFRRPGEGRDPLVSRTNWRGVDPRFRRDDGKGACVYRSQFEQAAGVAVE